jgi:hypothetical protein
MHLRTMVILYIANAWRIPPCCNPVAWLSALMPAESVAGKEQLYGREAMA